MWSKNIYKYRKLLSILVILTFLSVQSPAKAVYGGSSALGSNLILTIASTKFARTPFCSASMLSERIVVTAAHCIVKDQGKYPELRFKLRDIYVTLPGINASKDDIESRVKVLKIIVKPGYINIWKPEIQDASTQRDDIAFLFLEKALVRNYSIKVASKEEVAKFVENEEVVEHYGYGLQKIDYSDGSPYKLNLKSIRGYPTTYDVNPLTQNNSTTTLRTNADGKALCPGDSGGPWYGEFDGEKKIIAVTVAAGGCRGEPPYYGYSLGTLIYPYLDLMEQEWLLFLKDEDKIKAELYAQSNRFEIARANGNLIISTGCHAADINSELQMFSNNNWEVVAESEGMTNSDKFCPSTHPATPWVIADIKNGSLLRWRYWSPGAFDVTSGSFIYTKTTPTINVELNAKKLIVCYKGKIKKIVTALKPKCPKGFTKK